MVFNGLIYAGHVWNVVLGKDIDLGTHGSFYDECTHPTLFLVILSCNTLNYSKLLDTLN